MARRKRSKPSPYQPSLNFDEEDTDDLERCVDAIREDMRLGSPGRDPDSYDDMLYLAEQRGGAPIPDRTIRTGRTDGEDIRINPDLPDEEAGPVLAHEQVHRECNGERYEHLNPVRTRYSERHWKEILARRVTGR